jgi:hypothetical protein
MEKQFLLFLLYRALIDIRERSYETGDKESYWLSNLLHNVPLALNFDEAIKEVYKGVLARVEHDGMNKWLEARIQEFYETYPDFKPAQ